MPSIADAKKLYPELDGLDDNDVVDVLHQAIYQDLPREQVASALGVKPPPAPVEPRSWSRVAGDVGISALKGAIGVPEAAVGLANMASGGRAGKLAEEAGFRPKDAKAMLDEGYSTQQKEAFRKVQAAEGLGDTFMAAVQNPSVIGHSVVESLPSMGAGGVLARGGLALAPKLGGVTAAALGEGVVGAGSAAEQIRQQSADGLLTGKQAMLAGATGVATTGFAMLGGKIAQKLGIADVDTMLAGVATNPAARKGLVRSVLEGAASEGFLEELPQSVSEQVLQNIALNKPLDEGVNQAAVLGLLSGAAMGGGVNALNSFSGQPPAPGVTPPPVVPAGPLARAATAVAPGTAEAMAGPAPAPIDDPVAETISAMPDGIREKAQRAYAVINNPDAAKGIRQYNQKLLDGLLDQVAGDVATAQDEATKEAEALAESAPAATKKIAPVTQKIDPDTGEVTSAYAQRQLDAPKQEEGDILNAENKPFTNMAAAKKTARALGDGYAPFRLGVTAYVVRAKPVENADVSPSPAIQPVATGTDGSGMSEPGVGLAPGVGSGAVGAGALDAGPVPNQSAGSPVSLAAADPAAIDQRLIPVSKQPAALDTRAQEAINPIAETPNVQNPTQDPAQPGAKAQAAPVEAPETRTTPAAGQSAAGTAAGAGGVQAAGVAQTTVREIALKAQRDAGWNQDWPFVPADLGNADFRKLIRDDPSMTDAEKTQIMQSGYKLGVVPKAEATTPSADVTKPGPASLGSVKADMDHLFGVDQKRAKALDRIAKGTAYFGNGLKARQFIAQNGLKDTHQIVKHESGANRYDVREKASKESVALDLPAPVATENVAEPTKPELVKVKSISGKHYHVKQSDFQGTKPLLPLYKSNGERKAGKLINRENLDPDGEKQTAINASNADNPLFDVITARQGDTFATAAAAQREINTQALGESHEVVPASEVRDGVPGYVVRKKSATKEAAAQAAPAQPAIKDVADSAAPIDAISRAKKIATTLGQGGHVVGRELRFANGMRQMGLSDAELATIPADKIRARPDPEAARTKTDAASNEPTAPVADAIKAKSGIPADNLIVAHVGDKPKPAPAPKNGFKQLGKNTNGVMIEEDANGVRSYVDGGFRIAESVTMRPTRDGMKLGTEHKGEYLTAEEAKPTDVQQTMRDAVSVDGLTNEQVDQVAAMFDKPKVAPAKPDPLTEQEKAAKAKMLNAAGKLATLLSKNTRLNITPEQEQAMLPIVIELFEGAMDLGYVKFKQAARYVREFLANAIDQDAADSIPIDTLQGAYIATARRHADKDITPKKDVIAVETLEELGEVEQLPKKADTGGPKDGNATQQLDSPSPGPLEGTSTQDVRPTGEKRDAGNSSDGGRAGDLLGDARADDAGIPAAGRMGDGAGVVPVSAGGARADAKNGKKPRLPRAPRADAGDGLFGDAGGLTHEAGPNPAPNAPAIQAPQVKAEDFTITDELALGEGGQKTKFRNNVAAIRLLADLEQSGRLATPDEQAVLAKYVGWGGIPQAFDANNSEWAKEFAEITALMTPEELESARQSTRYAHFTSKPIIEDGIYAALRRFGFTGGKTLEAGAGVGNFMGLMPADMRSAGRFTAIEREPFSSAIARHLYPQQNVQRADFAEFKGNDAYFDAAVGNPPFASDPQTDRSGRKHLSGLSLHNYFFAKAVDMLREGGIMAQVITNSFMDAKTETARKYIGERTKLLGAIRLPNSAFAKNANTEVTTDIVFLQKLPDSEIGSKAARADAKRWLSIGQYRDARGRTVALNQYFIDNPGMMLGDFGAYGTMYGPEQPALVARPGQDTLALLKEAVGKLPEGVYKSVAETGTADHTNAAIEALKSPTVREGGYFIDGDKLMQRLPDLAGEARGVQITPETQWTEKTKLGDSGFERIKALAGMRGTVRGLIAAEMGDDAKAMKDLRATLNQQYDGYRDTHGLINDPSTLRVFEDDPDFPLLASLEHGYTPGIGLAAAKRMGVKMTKSTARKGPIFSRRVVAARQKVQKVDTPADALQVSMAERGKLDAAYIGELLGKEPEAVLKELSSGSTPLLFRDPATDEYVLRDAYLSGNVRAKLAQANAAGMFNNVTALEAVQPPEVASHEIVARLGSPWVPTSVYADFAKSLYGEDANAVVTYLKANSSYQLYMTGASSLALTNTWGTPAYPGDKMLGALLNNRSIKVTYTDADKKTRTDVEATETANTKAQELKERFSDWLFSDPDRSELLTKAYNETNNNYVTRVYDGSNMTFPGKVPDNIIKFRRHQRNAIARIVQDRTALLDHVVGAGKTFTIVAGAMELKRTGLARKPMVAVPNHLVKQWAADFYRLYPGANVLTATKKDFEKANRRKFLAKIATGDWDAVVIAHSSYGFIRPAPEFEAEFNAQEVKQIMATIKAVEDSDGDKPMKKRTIKQLEAMKEKLENRIRSLRDKPMDDLLDFEQLGVDQLFVDEAHLFKNLMFSTKMQQVQGLGDSAGSQRAYDMYVKAHQIYAKNGRGQGVVFATGTPVSNSLAEMYHMMRYLMPTQMKELGFESFDAWANTFASVEQVWMQAPSGDGFKASNRMSNFVNTTELLKMFDQVSDTVTMDDIKKAYTEENDGAEFPLPKLKGGRRTPVSLDKSPAQDAYMLDIAARAKAIEQRRGPPKKGEDNILVVMGDARKAAMDIRLVDVNLTEREKGGRIDTATDRVVERYKQYDAVKGTQIVFSDLGTPIKHAKAELKEFEALKARIAAGDEETSAKATFGDEAAIGTMEDVEAAQAEMDDKGADWLGAVQAALRGFSVYDDFRAALVEKGVPDAEIAFIHDYNTDDQKATLFRKVNAGQIRVLLGSTQKLGAGTNVQERLVAEHHLDVPWRPSDVEQREGRIERQGNVLMTEIPNFEIEILAYVTKDTLDMRMWQVQETKLKMINQLRTRKIGREIDNAFEDMELSAGEMQAAATGDVNLLKEIQLRNDVKKLEQKRRSFEAQRNDLITRKKRVAQNLRDLPAKVQRAREEASQAKAYFADLRDNPPPFSMDIDGKTYTDVSKAQAYLLAKTEAKVESIDLAGEKTMKAAPLSVEVNGELFKSRAALQDAFAEVRGDVEPIVWAFNGTEYRRRTKIGTAIRQNVVDSIADETVKPVGSIAGYTVDVEGQVITAGGMMVDVTMSRGGKVALSKQIISEDAARTPERVIRVVENMLESAVNEADYLQRTLDRAQKDAADLESVADAGVWPEEAKLEAVRAAHKEVLAQLKKKDEAPAADDGGDAPAFSRSAMPPKALQEAATPAGTAFRNDEVVLGKPRLNVRQPDGAVTRIDYELRDPVRFAQLVKDGATAASAREQATVGILTMDVDKGGQFKSLRNIEIFESKRGDGLAEKVVGAIMATLPDTAKLHIHEILPTATGFWDKMGAKFARSEEYMEAFLTPTQFRRAYDERTTAAGAQGSGGKPGASVYSRGRDGGSGVYGVPASQAGASQAVEAKRATAEVERIVTGIKSRWANAPSIVVAFDMQDARIPERVRQADQKQRSGGATGTPEGFYYQGTAYIISSQVSSQQDVARVLFHEVLGHAGLRGVFGDLLKPILQQLAGLRRKEVAAKAKEYGLDMANESQRLQAAEEVLAVMAQTQPELGYVKRAIAIIRTWLRRNVPGFKNMKLTDAEIIQNYILPARGFIERGRADARGMTPIMRYSFAGQNAATADKLSLATAQSRLESGEDAEAVRQDTGWSKGVDGKWRFEISDVDARRKSEPLSASYTVPLHEVISHAGLFAAYPALKYIPVKGVDGGVNEKDGSLINGGEMMLVNKNLDRADQLSVILHEIQHGIQNIEGFASGGNLREVDASSVRDAREQESRTEYRAADKAYRSDKTPENKRRFEAAATALESVGNDPSSTDKYEAYKRLAGETEARNTQTRQNLTDAQRRTTSPESTADVKASDVIVTFNGKDAKSAPIPANVRNQPTAPDSGGARQTDTPAFKKWFGASKVVDADGNPLVVYHGTRSDFSKFQDGPNFFTTNPESAAVFGDDHTIMPVFLSIKNPATRADVKRMSIEPSRLNGVDSAGVAKLQAAGFDGVVVEYRPGVIVYAAFNPTQIKSATGNNGNFDGTNPDIRFSRSLPQALAGAMNSAQDVKLPAGYVVHDFFKADGKLSWWHKSVGTQYNLAQRNPSFKKVFDGVQDFINDVSFYATEAADLAPSILPKLETWKDITKTSITATDNKAISAPIFEGTLVWMRNVAGVAVPVADMEAAAGKMSVDDKAQRLFREDHISEGVLKMWRGLPVEQFEALVNGKYERDMMRPGIVFTPAELKSLFKLTDQQIALYNEFRAATDKSLTNLAVADMVRFGGADVAAVRDVALGMGDVDAAAVLLRDHLLDQAEGSERSDVLIDTATRMIDKADKARDLMDRGYAPLSRFGSYSLDVVDTKGERVYFGLFESKADANRMARQMRGNFPGATVSQGTMSDEEYKLFAGVSPETVALFGEMLGLEAEGNEASSQAFQQYLKLAKANRSAMKRLIQRKGIAGFSEDPGRVLAGFVYSNARQTSSGLHMGNIAESVKDIPRGQGELKDAAVRLMDYVKNPQEEAQTIRGLLFAQYLGGSIASAMVNLTQPFAVSFPWLSQYGGVIKAASQMKSAVVDALKKSTGDARLDAALKKAEEDGIVSPQEVFQLMAQAQGKGTLKPGDGTVMGDAIAKGENVLSKVMLAWGKVFGVAEQFNRRTTFIAAYRTAIEQKMADPAAFAERAVNETQFVYNKGAKPRWARGAVGGVLFTFKSYSINYVELLGRMASSGPEGRKAALLALGMLFLMSGAEGLPFSEDLDDVVDGLMQRLGYNFSSKQAKQEFFTGLLGRPGAQFVERGVSGLAGVPIDVSGRLGMGNLIPGTGLLTKKTDHSRDLLEIAGPGGDFAKRTVEAVGKLVDGNITGRAGALATLSPVAVRNLIQANDMATTGMYRDVKGKKVIDTDGYDVLAKGIGFQPNDVASVQDATRRVQIMVSQNKMRESEIADKWAQGVFEGDQAKVQDAKDALSRWNETNPTAPIRIQMPQIIKRVKAMRMDKATRIARTAPKEIRASVRRELADNE